MSQRRREKVLRRKARMGSVGKRRREARRMRRHERRAAAFEAVLGPQSLGPGLEDQISIRLDPQERERMARIQKMFAGIARRGPERTEGPRGKVVLDSDLAVVYGSLVSGIAAEGVDERAKAAMKEKLNRLYGRCGG